MGKKWGFVFLLAIAGLLLFPAISSAAESTWLQEIFIKNLGPRTSICVDGIFQGVAPANSISYVDIGGYRDTVYPRSDEGKLDSKIKYQGGWSSRPGGHRLLALGGDVGSRQSYVEIDLNGQKTAKVTIHGSASFDDVDTANPKSLEQGSSSCRKPAPGMNDVYKAEGIELALKQDGSALNGTLTIRGQQVALRGNTVGNKFELATSDNSSRLAGELNSDGLILMEGSTRRSLKGQNQPTIIAASLQRPKIDTSVFLFSSAWPSHEKVIAFNVQDSVFVEYNIFRDGRAGWNVGVATGRFELKGKYLETSVSQHCFVNVNPDQVEAETKAWARDFKVPKNASCDSKPFVTRYMIFAVERLGKSQYADEARRDVEVSLSEDHWEGRIIYTATRCGDPELPWNRIHPNWKPECVIY